MGGCHIWYSEEGTGRIRSPPRPILVVLNITTYPSRVSALITVLLYNGRLLCGFSVPVKGLTLHDMTRDAAVAAASYAV